MGVTLERVQFKFASIIGELCSEPDILSQFAVWVDLRLAEYKLKGSISLDCSGDTPDPIWLKGILSALLEKRLTALKSADQHIGRGVVGNPMFHSTPITQRVGSAGLKQEATDEAADIFPVGFHAHRNTDNAPYSSYDFRKRRACETVTRHDSNSAYPAKMRRVENTKDDPIVISHESLMSVLNPRDSEDGATVPGNTDPSNSEHTTEISLSSDVDTTLHHRESYENDAEGGPNADDVVLRMVTETSRRDPKRDTRGITRAYDSARRIRSDVNSFQSWLISSSHGDSRKIEAIPPEELDTLLVDFFSTIKTRSGGDYDPNSLSALRSCLERHLREQGYQHLISSSPIFRQSQAAFKAKKQMLKMASNLSPPDIVVLRLNKLIGPFTPESLLNVLYWRNSFFFPCLRTKIDHFNLLWGDFKIIDAEDDVEYLALTGEASRSEQKSVSFLRFLNPMHSMVRAMPEDPDICPVEIFKEYRRHRPAGSLLPTSNFYLRPRDGTDLDSDVWFLNAPLGLHDIAKLIKVMKEKSGLLPSSD